MGSRLHDLTIVTSDRHRSWDTGPSCGLQQLKNHVAMLLLSAGTPMWVMGDEFARSQQGHDNPYNVDGPLSWVDWDSAPDAGASSPTSSRRWSHLRRAHPPTGFRFYGDRPDVDESHDSHSIAWCAGDLYVMVNAWWEPADVRGAGARRVAGRAGDRRTRSRSVTGLTLAPRGIVVLPVCVAQDSHRGQAGRKRLAVEAEAEAVEAAQPQVALAGLVLRFSE